MSGSLGLGSLVVYNWDPATQLAGYLAAQTAVLAGKPGAVARIVALGDSTTVGVGDDTTNIDFRDGPSYPADLTLDLAADGVPAQSDNFLGGQLNVDGRLTLLGDASWSGVSVPGSHAIGTQSAGSGFAFKLIAPGSYDQMKLNYADIGSGSLTVAVDGGPATTIQLHDTQRIVTQAIALPPALHSEVTVLSATATPVYVAGAAFENTAAPKVEVYNAGSQGTESFVVNQGASVGAVQYPGIGQLQGVVELSPSLVLIDYGLNDINNGVTTPAQTAANIATAVTTLQKNGIDAVIIIPEPFLSPYYATELPQLRADLHGVATALDVPIIDLSATVGDSFATTSAAGLYADGLHPNATYYAAIASDYARLLTSGTTATETLNVTGSTLAMPAGSALLLTGGGNAVTAGTNALVNLVGDGNRVAASAGDTVNVAGDNAVVASAAGLSVNLQGNGASITAGPSAIGIQRGTGEAINVSNGVIVLADGTGTLLTGAANAVTAGHDALVGAVGDGNHIAASAGDTVNVAGDNVVITSTNSISVNLQGNGASITVGPSSVGIQRGTGEAINMSNGVVALADGTSALLTGAGNTVSVGTAALVGVVGDGNHVAASAEDTVNVAGNNAVITSATGISVNLEGNGASVVTAGASWVQVHHGTGEAITVSNGVIVLQDGTGALLTGAGNMVSVGAAALVGVVGDGNHVAASAEDTVNVAGNNAVITSAAGINVNLEGNGTSVVAAGSSLVQVHHGVGEAITVSNSTIMLQDGTGAAITGSGDTVRVGAGVSAVITGSGNQVQSAAPSQASVAIDTISVGGSANMVFLGGGPIQVADTSSGLTLVLSGSQALAAVDIVAGFGVARGGVVDLTGGAGGYADAAAALAALKSDGQGGSVLSLGAGAVDFTSLAPAAFGVGNFHVG